MRNSSISFLSFTAFAASLADGAAVSANGSSAASSAPSSRRSSVQPSSSALSKGRARAALSTASVVNPTITATDSDAASSPVSDAIDALETTFGKGAPVVAVAVGRQALKTTTAAGRKAIATKAPVNAVITNLVAASSSSSSALGFSSSSSASTKTSSTTPSNSPSSRTSATLSSTYPPSSSSTTVPTSFPGSFSTWSFPTSTNLSSTKPTTPSVLSSSPASSSSSTSAQTPSTFSSKTVSSSAVKSSSVTSMSSYASSITSVLSKASLTTTSSSRVSSSSISSSSASATVSAVTQSLVDMGCWYDTSSNRTMTGPSYTDSKMTRESCAAFCSESGMQWSGTEYGQECYCSAVVPVAEQAWWCNMPCGGNSNEICGSGNALSISYASQAANTFSSTAQGCYADSSTTRTFTGPSFTSTNMTTESCSTFCSAQDFEYSGTEYGSQCYCSRSAPWSATVSCSMACSGNSSEICGDGNALSVLHTTKASASSPVSSSTPAATPTANKLVTTVDMNQKFSSWSTWKARGVNLGNWLVLEEWMHASWFNSVAPGAIDEWTLCQSLGTVQCQNVLQAHWASWITADDIKMMASMGVNTLRIPIGYWAFVAPSANEPYIKSTQLQELSRVLGYAAGNAMTVVLDLHGLPGSQNGKDHSGHQGVVEFWTAANQARALQVVQAAATWIATNGHTGIISALEVANEPAIPDWATWLQYKDYVLASHKIIKQTIPTVATMFHDGFWPYQPWNQFFTTSDNVVLDTHKYWAFAPTTFAQAEQDVCSYVTTFEGMNMPIFVGEFSLSVQGDVSSFVTKAVSFFESQMAVWLQSAGAAFWSIKVFNGDGNGQNVAWSAEGIAESGLLAGADVWTLNDSVC